jgi:hypothetical protein
MGLLLWRENCYRESWRMMIETGLIKAYGSASSLSWDWAISGGTVSDNQWHHVAMTFDSSTGMKLYLDGMLNGSDTTTGNLRAAGEYDVHIGYTEACDIYNNANYNGTVDEVRMYSHALTADEILLHYQSELSKYNSTEYRFYENVTNLTSGTYTYYGWANDTTGTNETTDDGNPRYISVDASDKFYVYDTIGTTVAALSDLGNIILKGTCTAGGSCASPPADSFIIQNSSGSSVSYIDPSGNMCITDPTCSDHDADCSSPGDGAFIINDGSNNVIYINASGRMCLKGALTQSGTP